jgi:hypothetical protein
MDGNRKFRTLLNRKNRPSESSCLHQDDRLCELSASGLLMIYLRYVVGICLVTVFVPKLFSEKSSAEMNKKAYLRFFTPTGGGIRLSDGTLSSILPALPPSKLPCRDLSVYPRSSGRIRTICPRDACLLLRSPSRCVKAVEAINSPDFSPSPHLHVLSPRQYESRWYPPPHSGLCLVCSGRILLLWSRPLYEANSTERMESVHCLRESRMDSRCQCAYEHLPHVGSFSSGFGCSACLACLMTRL